ncbi:hypothetical protein KY310_04970 [Candidatus Woesearchaeota archaeon]|nr:hypothetical protein [Candidatus Woesearchaeota archaeon]
MSEAEENPVSELERICDNVKKDVVKIIQNANSGHLGACLSSAELMTALYFGDILNYDPTNPFAPDRDRVLLRGHLGPLRYKIFSILGWLKEEELLQYRALGSRLQGHESMEVTPGVDITPSGSLGMVLSYGVGAAVSAKKQGKEFKTYVFLGDGEEQEGNVAEAARHAAVLNLDNLICIMDQNKKQLSRPTSMSDKGDIKKIWEGYGWNVLQIEDGHDFQQIQDVLTQAKQAKQPVLVIANTIKANGLEGCAEHYSGYHTLRVCPDSSVEEILKQPVPDISEHKLEFLQHQKPKASIQELDITVSNPPSNNLEISANHYLKQLDTELAKRQVPLYVMTADLIEQNFVEECNFSENTQFIDVGIREQHLFACAHGISVTEPNARIWINSGDSFLYRGSDQLNVICQAGSRMMILGGKPGLSGGTNGPTHQSTGQPGVLLTMPGLIFLEPADVDDLYNCLNYAFNKHEGPSFIRIHHASMAPLPSVGPKRIDHYVVQDCKAPDIVLVGSGLAMTHALEAVDSLHKEGIDAKLVNVVNPKSLDCKFTEYLEAGKPVLTIYNGNKYVLQSAVATAVMESGKCIPSRIYGHGFDIGTSGSTKDLLAHFKFDAGGITGLVKECLRNDE